jgi:hypothetical protein
MSARHALPANERARLWTEALEFWPPYANCEPEIPVVVLDSVR